MQLYVDRVLVETIVAANGHGAVVRVGGVASGEVVPGLGIVPIPWRGRTVELRLAPVGHAAIGVDAEVHCGGIAVPPLGRAAERPVAGPGCPGCGAAGGDAADGTRCRSCFASDADRHARAVRRLWGGAGALGAVIAGVLAFGAMALARSPELGIAAAGPAAALALFTGGVGGVLLARAWRGAPWSPPVAPPAVRWNLDVHRMLQTVGELERLASERGPAWDRMRDTLIST